MPASQHSARHPDGDAGDVAFADEIPPGANVPRPLALPAASGRVTPLRPGQGPVAHDSDDLDENEAPSAWRPLIGCWLLLLTAAASGGAVLQYLGPPEARRVQERTPEPPAAAAPAAAPPSPGRLPEAQEPPGAAAPDQASATPRGRRLIVFHPVKFVGTGQVQRLAGQIGLTADQVLTEAVAAPPSRAIIRFYAPDDHPSARRLGRELGQLGYPWQIENLSERSSPVEGRALEVWLPER